LPSLWKGVYYSMKTLKFRAWHKTKKKMFEVKCIEFGSCIWSKDGNWFVPISEVEIMQFTGLLDRHGKEIYEGDIVSFDDMGEEGYEYKEGFDFTNVARVEFKNARFQLTDFRSDNSGVLDSMNNCHDDFADMFKYYAEVIGNCLENPDLLEGGTSNAD